MYCGDETGAFVGDLGHATSRFGYGGDDSPKLVIPSQIGTTSGSNGEDRSKNVYGAPALAVPRENFHLKPIYGSKRQWHSSSPSLEKHLNDGKYPSLETNTLENESNNSYGADGEITDWDAWEKIWEYAFDNLRVHDSSKNRSNISSDDSIAHPILVVEQQGGFTVPKGQRETITEIMFEKFNVPAMYIMPSSVLSAFSIGRHNALVIDCGAVGCRATPVVDGMDLKSAFRYNLRGGDWFSDQIYEKLIVKGFDITPRYKARCKILNKRQPSVTRSFELNAIRDVMYEFKSLHCGLYPTKIEKQEDVKSAVKTHLSHSAHDLLRSFELPDGTAINLIDDHQDLFLLPEILFEDKVDHPPLQPDTKSINFSESSIQKLAYGALTATDADARKELSGNILLVGGGSQLKGMENRLTTEMTNLLPMNYRCRVISPKHTVEKIHAPWIGGSILTSLGSFQQLWLSRKQYDDYGVTLASRRFKC